MNRETRDGGRNGDGESPPEALNPPQIIIAPGELAKLVEMAEKGAAKEEIPLSQRERWLCMAFGQLGAAEARKSDLTSSVHTLEQLDNSPGAAGCSNDPNDPDAG